MNQVINYDRPINSEHPLMQGIVSRWKCLPYLNNGGGTFYDLAKGLRRPNDGTLTNGPTWQGAMGRPGGNSSVHFDGTDDCVALTTNFGDGATSNSPFSWFCWFRQEQKNTDQILVGRYDGTNLFQIHTQWLSGSSFNLRTAYGTSPFQSIAGGTVIVGKWQFASFTYSGAGVGTLYLDSVLIGTASVGNAFTSATAINFGRRGGDNAEPFQGSMDEIGRFSRCLSAAEIAALYQSTQRPDDPTLNWFPRRVWSFGAGAAAISSYQVILQGKTFNALQAAGGVLLANR